MSCETLSSRGLTKAGGGLCIQPGERKTGGEVDQIGVAINSAFHRIHLPNEKGFFDADKKEIASGAGCVLRDRNQWM